MSNTNNNDSPKGCIIVFAVAFVVALLGWGITTLIESNSNPYKNYECEWENCSEVAVDKCKGNYLCEEHSKEYDGFYNDYGTPTTKCSYRWFNEETLSFVHCDKYIAKTGDTRYCEEHSHKCAECYCYIDNDATYCMDCLEDYFK